MNKYELYVANEYLTYYPDNLSWDELMQEILNEHEDIDVWEFFEGFDPEFLIDCMQDSLKNLLRIT